jgi:hypothetical protein
MGNAVECIVEKPSIPQSIEQEYLKMSKLGFRKLFILFDNINQKYLVSIIPPKWCKQSEWFEIIRSNEI